MAKDWIEYQLCRQPALYAALLENMGNKNPDKILFLREVPGGGCVFDVGANRGFYTRLFSYVSGPKGEVHAFEPIPRTFELLRSKITGDPRAANVTLNNCGLGNDVGTVQFSMPGDDDMQVSMRPHGDGSWAGKPATTFDCRIDKLDHYFATKKLARFDFLKIDVEGAELLVLQGGAEVLSKYRPAIFLEVCHDWIKDFGYQPMDLISLLRGYGYQKFSVVKDKVEPLVDFERQLSPGGLGVSANLLCQP